MKTYHFEFPICNMYLSEKYENKQDGLQFIPLENNRELERSREREHQFSDGKRTQVFYTTNAIVVQKGNTFDEMRDNALEILSNYMKLLMFAQRRHIFYAGYDAFLKKGTEKTLIESKRYSIPHLGKPYDSPMIRLNLSDFLDKASNVIRDKHLFEETGLRTALVFFINAEINKYPHEILFLMYWNCLELLASRYAENNFYDFKIIGKKKPMKLKKSQIIPDIDTEELMVMIKKSVTTFFSDKEYVEKRKIEDRMSNKFNQKYPFEESIRNKVLMLLSEAGIDDANKGNIRVLNNSRNDLMHRCKSAELLNRHSYRIKGFVERVILHYLDINYKESNIYAMPEYLYWKESFDKKK